MPFTSLELTRAESRLLALRRRLAEGPCTLKDMQTQRNWHKIDYRVPERRFEAPSDPLIRRAA